MAGIQTQVWVQNSGIGVLRPGMQNQWGVKLEPGPDLIPFSLS